MDIRKTCKLLKKGFSKNKLISTLGLILTTTGLIGGNLLLKNWHHWNLRYRSCEDVGPQIQRGGARRRHATRKTEEHKMKTAGKEEEEDERGKIFFFVLENLSLAPKCP